MKRFKPQKHKWFSLLDFFSLLFFFNLYKWWTFLLTSFNTWAASWQNQQNGMCAQRRQISLGICPVWSESSLEESVSPWLPIKSPVKTDDWADAQADLSLRWAHMPFCWFCHDVAHIMCLPYAMCQGFAFITAGLYKSLVSPVELYKNL